VAPQGKVCDSNPNVCDFVCTSDCGGACKGYSTCNTQSCSCVCQQNVTCPPGFIFVNQGGGMCGCACDAGALTCPGNMQKDTTSCTCVCKSDCGGCMQGTQCNPSTCLCSTGIG
jgi:hypothetical protein